MTIYQTDVRTAVANTLDAFAALDPSKIISKVKLHLLEHSEEGILAYGPLIGAMTELFECFNAIFRFCSILSNHLAPSRDIARQLADQEGLKHRLTGGWWPEENDAWRQAGYGVRDYFQTHPVLQKLIGWSAKTSLIHGVPYSWIQPTATDVH